MFFSGTVLAGNITFTLCNSFLAFVDLTGKPEFMLKYKIQEDKNVPVSSFHFTVHVWCIADVRDLFKKSDMYKYFLSWHVFPFPCPSLSWPLLLLFLLFPSLPLPPPPIACSSLSFPPCYLLLLLCFWPTYNTYTLPSPPSPCIISLFPLLTFSCTCSTFTYFQFTILPSPCHVHTYLRLLWLLHVASMYGYDIGRQQKVLQA